MSSIKVGALIIRTLAKPMANSLKTHAKEHAMFREFCISIAQRSHQLEMTWKMKFLGYKKEKIRPLNDTTAIESGANFLSETFIFTVALSIILAESWRSRWVARNHRDRVDESLENLNNKNKELTGLFNRIINSSQTNYSKLEQIENDNGELRNTLDKILSINMGIKNLESNKINLAKPDKISDTNADNNQG